MGTEGGGPLSVRRHQSRGTVSVPGEVALILDCRRGVIAVVGRIRVYDEEQSLACTGEVQSGGIALAVAVVKAQLERLIITVA